MKSIQIEGTGDKRPLLNLTPHIVRLFPADPTQGPICVIPSHGTLRLVRDGDQTYPPAVFATIMGETADDTLSLTMARYTRFTSVRQETIHTLENVALLVSMPVADFIVQQNLYPTCSIMIPDSGPQHVVRSTADGQILGVRRFILYR